MRTKGHARAMVAEPDWRGRVPPGWTLNGWRYYLKRRIEICEAEGCPQNSVWLREWLSSLESAG